MTTKSSGDGMRHQHLLKAPLATISAVRSKPYRSIHLVPSPWKSLGNGFWQANFQEPIIDLAALPSPNGFNVGE